MVAICAAYNECSVCRCSEEPPPSKGVSWMPAGGAGSLEARESEFSMGPSSLSGDDNGVVDGMDAWIFALNISN
jgi:hypothetical protein